MADSDLDKSFHGFPTIVSGFLSNSDGNRETGEGFDQLIPRGVEKIDEHNVLLDDVSLLESLDSFDPLSSAKFYHHGDNSNNNRSYLIKDDEDSSSKTSLGMRRKGSFVGRQGGTSYDSDGGGSDGQNSSVTGDHINLLSNINGAPLLGSDCSRANATPKVMMQEFIAGVVVALATIPTSISYAAVIGISPSTGIWNSAILGLCSSMIGGAPGMITGAAGAAALPMSRIYKLHGLPWMTAAVLVASFIELSFGFSKLSRLADIVTEPVVIGFFNALSMFIVRSQVSIIS